MCSTHGTMDLAPLKTKENGSKKRKKCVFALPKWGFAPPKDPRPPKNGILATYLTPTSAMYNARVRTIKERPGAFGIMHCELDIMHYSGAV